MRAASDAWNAALEQQTIEPRFTFALSFDNDFTDVVYIKSRADSPVPDGATVLDAMIEADGVSASSQQVDPLTGATTLGKNQVKILDVNNSFRDMLATKFAAGDSIRHKPAKLYYVPDLMDWREVRDDPEFTMLVDSLSWNAGVWTISLKPKIIFAKRKIFVPVKTNLKTDFAVGGAEMEFYDVSRLVRTQHGSAWTDGASSTVGYVKVNDEVLRYTTIDASTTELVTNGNFTSAAGWTFGASWSHDAANSRAAASSALDYMERSITVTSGLRYIVTYTVSNRSAGSVTVKLGGTAGTARGTNGTFVETITAGGGGLIEFTGGGGGFTGNIDDVSVAPLNRITGLTPARFGTVAAAHVSGTEADQNRRTEVKEYAYLELPAIKMMLALLTNGIHVPATAFASWPKIPDHWGAQISINDIDLASFENIGLDIWNPADDTKGRLARIDGVENVDCRSFIEKELCQLAGVVLIEDQNGKIGIKRFTPVRRTATATARIGRNMQLEPLSIRSAMEMVHTRYVVKWSKDAAVTKEFRRTTEVWDSNAESTWNRGETRELSFVTLHGSLDTESAISWLFRRNIQMFSGAPFLLDVLCPHPLLGIGVLDTVAVENINVPDWMTGGSLDRTYTVIGKSIEPGRGRIRLSLFGATGLPADYNSLFSDAKVLSDSYYGTRGTSLVTYLAANYPSAYSDSGGTLTITAAITLPGGSTYTFYYYLGNITVNDGVVVTITNNVGIEYRGLFTCNGIINGIGTGLAGAASSYPAARGTQGLVGDNVSVGGVFIRNSPGAYIQNSGGTVTQGTYKSLPYWNLKNNGTTLDGLPTDGRGSSGGAGGRARVDGAPAVSPGVTAGAAGGAGGGSLLTVGRGFTFGPSGFLDLSGVQGSQGTRRDVTDADGDPYAYIVAGGGAGGCAGTWTCVIDGFTAVSPVISGATVRSKNAAAKRYPDAVHLANATGGRTLIGAGNTLESIHGGLDTATEAWESTALWMFAPKQVAAADDVSITNVAAPTNLVLASGNAEVIKHTDGTISPRIKVTFTPSVSNYVRGTRVEWRVYGTSNYTTFSSLLPPTISETWIEQGIKSGVAYDVRIRAENRYGYESAYTTVSNHTVLGLTDPPPDVSTLTLTNNTNGSTLIAWTVASTPTDLLGYELRYSTDASQPAWSSMTKVPAAELLEKGRLSKEVTGIPIGAYWFAIKALDTTGNYSTNATFHKISGTPAKFYIGMPSSATGYVADVTDEFTSLAPYSQTTTGTGSITLSTSGFNGVKLAATSGGAGTAEISRYIVGADYTAYGSWNFASGRTIEFQFVIEDSGSGIEAYFGTGDCRSIAGGDGAMGFRISGTTIYGRNTKNFDSDTSMIETSLTTLTKGVKYTAAVTLINGRVEYYINGVLLATHTGKPNVFTDALASSSGWTFNAGWSHDAGNGEADAAAATTTMTKSLSLSPGWYAVTYTVKNYSAGTVRPKLSSYAGAGRSSNGTQTDNIECTAASTTIEFEGVVAFTGSVDDISIAHTYDIYPSSLTITDKGIYAYCKNNVAYGNVALTLSKCRVSGP